MARRSRRVRLLAGIAAVTLVAAACTSAWSSTRITSDPEPRSEITIPNEGGEGEGHTPIGFAGTGTGLFVGDNLNPGFPEGDGVQTFMTFPLPQDSAPTSATLRSDLLQTRGTPFDDLGALLVERVEYTDFGPQLFDLPPSGAPTTCTLVGGTSVTCDVTAAVQAASQEGASSVQFRLRFEQIADNDGRADLAMFYRSDSNTNEKGLFELVITGT